MATTETGSTHNRGQTPGNGAGTQGTPQENEALVRKMISTLNEHDANKMLPFMSDNVMISNVAFNKTYQGRDGFREYLTSWITAFPDYQLEVTNVVATNNKAMCEFTARATHSGPLNTPNGSIPATNRRVELRFVEAYELNNGKIAKGRTYFDPANLMSQIGLAQKH